MDKLEKIVSHSRDGVGPMRTERHHLICSLFEEYIEMYASRDDRLTSHFSDNFSGYAGSSDVLITDKAEWLRITRQDFAQIPERIDIEMLDLSLQDLAEDIVVVTAFFYIHLPIPEDILSNETARLALVFRHEKTAWKIVHSGISLPYGLAHDDEIYPMSRLEKRNLELEEIINVRTGELKRSEALFREMFDNMKTGVAIYEAVDNGNDFLFKDLNPSGCNQAQVEQKDIINKSVKTVFPGIVDLGLFDVFQRVWQTGEPELQSSSVYNDKRIELWVENYVYKLTSGEIVAVYDDISKRKESERKQAFLQKRLEALWKLSSMLDADLDSICDTILEEIVEMTESQYGFFGFIDDDEQILKLYSWSNKVLADCAISHKQIELPIENSGIWGNAVRDRKPFILNEYQQDCPNKKGLPDGHVPLSRIMSIPVLISNKIVAVAVVANKESDYSNNDTKQIVAFLTNAHIILERKQKELSIIQAKEEWQRSFDAITDIVTIQDRDMRIVRANKAAHSLFEVPLGELVGRRCYEVFRDITEPCLGCPMIETIQDIKSHSEIIHHENLGKTFLVSSAQIDELNGNDSYLVHIAKDITEQKRLEESLFQSHKMEAIGTLAGGIAHDFNNILSAILGYSQIVKEDLPVGSPIEKDIDMVIQSGKRAADLVKQILTFSRKKEHHLQTLTPHPIIKEALQMLQSTLPATVEIKEDIDRECGKIEADPTNIHQIVVNLCSNALHAMEQQKGTLTVKLSREDINAEDVEAYDHVAAGAFVVLSVSDTGQGIDKKRLCSR